MFYVRYLITLVYASRRALANVSQRNGSEKWAGKSVSRGNQKADLVGEISSTPACMRKHATVGRRKIHGGFYMATELSNYGVEVTIGNLRRISRCSHK